MWGFLLKHQIPEVYSVAHYSTQHNFYFGFLDNCLNIYNNIWHSLLSCSPCLTSRLWLQHQSYQTITQRVMSCTVNKHVTSINPSIQSFNFDNVAIFRLHSNTAVFEQKWRFFFNHILALLPTHTPSLCCGGRACVTGDSQADIRHVTNTCRCQQQSWALLCEAEIMRFMFLTSIIT